VKRLAVTPLGRPLRARVRVPGDKSISHRALLLGAIAEGVTPIRGLLQSEDVRATMGALRAMGVRVDASAVHGGPWSDAGVLDCGNSGTTARLLLGALAGRASATLVGDGSLSRRPMGRLVKLLAQMGAQVEGGDTLPLTVRRGRLVGANVLSKVASAQVKSAVLLAGLHAEGTTRYVEPVASRDHTERMLVSMGGRLRVEQVRLDGAAGALHGEAKVLEPGPLQGVPIHVPGDFSSAAYWLVAAAILPGSDVVVEDVGLNPTRTGLLDVLRAMGAGVSVEERGGAEPIGDVRVRGATLHGVQMEGKLIPRLIDELPILAVAAAFAQGETVVRDASELKVKESDRILSVVEGLRAMDVEAEPLVDGFRIVGGVGCGAAVDSRGDHRIAMSFAVAGLRTGMMVNDVGCVDTSYPDFARVLGEIGA